METEYPCVKKWARSVFAIKVFHKELSSGISNEKRKKKRNNTEINQWEKICF